MSELVIHCKSSAATEPCALCGTRTPTAKGPQLYRADSLDRVCRTCGKKHAPSLVALLDLAGAAERVGHIGRHNLVPPMTALLDLAGAAEMYTCTAPSRCRKAS
jgi:hypothetical protein